MQVQIPCSWPDHLVRSASKRAAFCVLAVLCFVYSASPVRADAVSPERFLAEAPLAWERYQTFADTLSGRIHGRRYLGNKPIADSVIVCKASGQNRLAEVEAIPALTDFRKSLTGPREGNVYGKNRAYSFHIRRPNPESPWVLVGLDIPRQGGKSSLDRVFAEFSTYKAEAVRASRMKLSELVKEPTFRVLKINTVQKGGEELQEVVFNNEHTPKGGVYSPLQSGTLLLDPKHDWCLRSYQASILGSDVAGEVTGSYDYEFTADGHAVLKEYKMTQTVHKWSSPNVPADMSNVFVTHITYQLRAGDKWPDKDFTLTAYGLPEPPGTDWRPPTPWYIWIGLAAIVLIVAGAVFSWLRRRAVLARAG